jgi:hypothetical protein
MVCFGTEVDGQYGTTVLPYLGPRLWESWHSTADRGAKAKSRSRSLRLIGGFEWAWEWKWKCYLKQGFKDSIVPASL